MLSLHTHSFEKKRFCLEDNGAEAGSGEHANEAKTLNETIDLANQIESSMYFYFFFPEKIPL